MIASCESESESESLVHSRIMFTTGVNLVMTVIGFAVSTMFIVFVCSRIVCARIHLNASRRSYPAAASSRSENHSIPERRIYGLEPVVIASFPTKKFSDDLFSSGDDSQCTVCLAEYQSKDTLRFLPYCSHYFHVNCIDTWLRQHATCPVCRISLRDSPERKFTMQGMSSSVIRPFNMGSLDSYSNHSLYINHGHFFRVADNSRMEPIQEDQFATELDALEAGEGPSTKSAQLRSESGIHDMESSSSRVHPICCNH